MTNFADMKFVILEDGICYDWDDYCVWGAVLYDIENRKIVTTKYGHGTDMSERAVSIELQDAVDNKLVTPEEIIMTMLKALPLGVTNTDAIRNNALCASIENPTAIPVTVTGGRKFKGNGYIIYAEKEPVRYGLGAYHNEYHHYPVILDPATGKIVRINSFGYCEYSQEFKDAFYNSIIANTAFTVGEVRNIAHAWAYNMSYYACDSDNYRYLINKIASRGTKDFTIPEVVTNAINIELENRRIVEEQKMAEKLPAIIDWVKKNTDKTTEEEILALAKHIYCKHN